MANRWCAFGEMGDFGSLIGGVSVAEPLEWRRGDKLPPTGAVLVTSVLAVVLTVRGLLVGAFSWCNECFAAKRCKQIIKGLYKRNRFLYILF